MYQPPPSLPVWIGLLQAQNLVLDAVQGALMTEQELPVSWYEVLARLQRAPDGRMRMQDLARQVLLSKSGLTRLCDRIEEAGLIQRASCPSDRRGTFAEITPAGGERFERAAPVVWRALEESLGAHLTAREQAALTSAFDKLIAANAPSPA